MTEEVEIKLGFGEIKLSFARNQTELRLRGMKRNRSALPGDRTGTTLALEERKIIV